VDELKNDATSQHFVNGRRLYIEVGKDATYSVDSVQDQARAEECSGDEDYWRAYTNLSELPTVEFGESVFSPRTSRATRDLEVL
jgi:hypothetical protein